MTRIGEQDQLAMGQDVKGDRHRENHFFVEPLIPVRVTFVNPFRIALWQGIAAGADESLKIMGALRDGDVAAFRRRRPPFGVKGKP